MRLIHLVEALSSRHNVTKKALKDISEDIFATIRESVANGDSVTIHGFGTFTRELRASRNSRNPRSGATLRTKEKHYPKFKAGKAFRDQVES